MAARRATAAEMVKAFMLRILIGLMRLVERQLWLDRSVLGCLCVGSNETGLMVMKKSREADVIYCPPT